METRELHEKWMYDALAYQENQPDGQIMECATFVRHGVAYNHPLLLELIAVRGRPHIDDWKAGLLEAMSP